MHSFHIPVPDCCFLFDNPDAAETTPLDADHGYAGSFVIFGHGGCAGDEGHCEIPANPDDTDDLRLPHPLHPATKPVIVTEALRRVEGESFTITAFPVLPGKDGRRPAIRASAVCARVDLSRRLTGYR